MSRWRRTLPWLILLLFTLGVGPTNGLIASADPATDFETDLEDVRQALGIPGMAAAVVQDQQLVWSAGFGFADLEKEIPATPDTPFGLASVTKPIAATLIMQLVEEGVVDLDALVSSYGVELPNGDGVTVRHLLTHTSEGTPGAVHNYNGNRYGYLGGVIEGATGRTFSTLLGEQVLIPLGMTDTALNPLNAWGAASSAGFEELSRTIGWGSAFDHYPDVYGRLAQPYQFDNDYSTILGMYHLIHSPAAGGISSADDLAKFDIALDAGALLDESTLRMMHSPAVPTVPGQSDLAYGLGWYVQEFEGLRLIWHAGRWPPSTSALYLKVPELDLTFIVLANTDNLTVPFSGIGDGDLSHSLPALTFLHHYAFPQAHGTELPDIDWWTSGDALIEQLAAGDDPEVAAFLERELWSYRQAFAGSGQFERSETLRAAVAEAFPESTMRYDTTFTNTVGKMPVASPLPSAASFTVLSRLVLAWLAIVAVSVVWMAIRVLPPKDGWWPATTIWLLATLLLGPIALLAYDAVRKGGEQEAASQVLGASLFHGAGYGAAWVVSIWLLIRGGENPNPLLTLGAVILVPAVGSLFLVRAPLLTRSGIAGFRRAARSGILAEAITWSLGLAVFFSFTVYIDNRWISTIPHPTSPYFGAMMSLLAFVGAVAFLPLHWLLRRRGFTIWPSVGSSPADATGVRVPTLRDSWWILATAVIIMAAAIAASLSAFQ